jgi:hydroxymethylpyrimidine/phosphomethylpyrimidine kinase
MNYQLNAPWPVVLTIAGFDPSSGAGISADLKTFAAHNCYGVAAITALTVQNTREADSLHPVEPSVLRSTIKSLLVDGRAKSIKIGMLANRAIAEVVREVLDANTLISAVLDPVSHSASGLKLLDAAGFDFLRDELLSRVLVVTPNLAEAAALTGLKVENVEGMKAAAQKLVQMGARAAVVTGGHLDKAVDVFFDGVELQTLASDRVKPDNTHGTGCTFSSAIAANLATGRHLHDAVVLAKAYVTEAIRKAYTVGSGRLPLNHLYRMQENLRAIDHSPSPEVAEPVH